LQDFRLGHRAAQGFRRGHHGHLHRIPAMPQLRNKYDSTVCCRLIYF
jgi:hypothetical protein